MLKHIEATTENATAAQQLIQWHLLQHGVEVNDVLRFADHQNANLVEEQRLKLLYPSFLEGKEGTIPPAYYGSFTEDETVMLGLARVSINVPRANLWRRIRSLNLKIPDEDNISLQIHSLMVSDQLILNEFIDELLELAKSLGVRLDDDENSEAGEIRACVIENPELIKVLIAKGFELKRRRARQIRIGKTVIYFSDFVRKKQKIIEPVNHG